MNSEDRFVVNVLKPEHIDRVAQLSTHYRHLARMLDTIPNGRLRALALTDLEASFNWAIRAVMEVRE